jgi:Protein tyrosine and serine/threonine kinase
MEQASAGHDILLLEPLTRVCRALQVHHPHAVRFFGACTKRQPYMIVTEYLPGGRWASLAAVSLARHHPSSGFVEVVPCLERALLHSCVRPLCSAVGCCRTFRERVVLDLLHLRDFAMLLCSLADLFKRAEMYFPSMRRAVVIALDCAKGMSYLHCHKCATLSTIVQTLCSS